MLHVQFVHIYSQRAEERIYTCGLDLFACHIGSGFVGFGRMLKVDATNNLGERNRRATRGRLVFIRRDVLDLLV
jgi:hypothetical protein